MKKTSSWLVFIFMIVFWLFRVATTYCTKMEKDFVGFKSFNLTVEVIILFITILCIILFYKRNIIGAILYLISYGYYFGEYLLTTGIPTFINSSESNMVTFQNSFVAIIGLVLAIFACLDIVLDKINSKNYRDKKTDWFFKNEQYDRKLDDRADKNQYRNY